MDKIRFAYKDGKTKALTMSYDDGRNFDRRLAEIFDRYGIRGTFHLNSGVLDDSAHVSADEIPVLYKNHEVSCHTLTHPYLERISPMEVVHEILADKENLEKACGYVVRGMSYPFGTTSDKATEILRSLGMKYSRTTKSTGGFGVPDDFMYWNPTCHHGDPKLLEKLEQFKNLTAKQNRYLSLFYVWGHSYEFDTAGNWNVIEEFCRQASGMEDTWYATNIEICDYITALRSAEMSTDRSLLYNPSAVSVWAVVGGEPVECKPGVVTKLF